MNFCADVVLAGSDEGLKAQVMENRKRRNEKDDRGVYVLTRMLLDPIHAMWRFTDATPQDHVFRPLLMKKASEALFVPRPGDVDAFNAKHPETTYEKAMIYNPKSTNKKVRRDIPAPKVVMAKLKALETELSKPEFNDPETGVPLLSADAVASLRQLSNVHAARGCLSDPSVVSLYTKIGVDKKDNLAIYATCRGDGNLENFHRKINHAFQSYNVGPQLAELMLLFMVYRHNVRAARSRRTNIPNVGHYNHELYDKINIVGVELYGERIHEWWTQIADYIKSEPEPFGIMSPVEPDVDFATKMALEENKIYLKSLSEGKSIIDTGYTKMKLIMT